MKRIVILTGLSVLFLLPSAVTAANARITESLDANWHFFKGDAPGAEQPQFDDHAWRKLNVPNDWSIAGPFCETNPAGGAGAYLPTGVAWYRKEFTLPENDSNQCVFVLFDGVMANSDVWINGVHLGHRPYGYVSFYYELTGHLKFGAGQTNVLAVRTDTSQQPASRWYAGSGIYRNVHLIVTDPLHFTQWGVFVCTAKISATRATVKIQMTLTNEAAANHKFILQTQLISPNGKIAVSDETASEIVAHDCETYSRQIAVSNPQLWDLDSPNLYQAVTEIRSGGKIVDAETNTFGIRDAQFKAATGFWLNGRNFKIKGVCLHAEVSAFGAAVPLSVWAEYLKTLKALGVNAIRTAHNPPAPEFLDLCDRMGFLVMDEMFDCWTVGKNPYDYHLYFRKWSKIDVRDTVRRDRNHPSIIIYSAGNEIHDTPHAELAKSILSTLLKVCHAADPTRPVTMALFRPNVSHDYDDGLADMLDVVGQNYRENEILAAHEQKPTRKILGTENHPDRRTWVYLRDNPPYAGQFLWSGMDYLGESRHWPVIAAGSGLLDRTGEIKPIGYEQASWWSDKPMVYMTRRVAPSERVSADPGFTPLDRPQVLFPDWTPKNSAPHVENVEVYSNCKQVELFLNGKSLGAQTIHADASPRVWKVNFEPGTLKAEARNDGKVVATDELRAAGKPEKIVLTMNHRTLDDDWNDVAFVRAVVVDKHGVRVPRANNLISFKVSGPGVIAAVDNANNSSHEPFQASERKAYEGRCVASIKANANSGRIVVTASSPNLESGKIVIGAREPR
jgi:beta-galactosidase